MSRLAAIWAERRVLNLLVKRDLRVRYAQSFLGYLWTIIDPLANALIYFVIFVVIFRRADAGWSPYFLFLLTGLLPWQWFNASVVESPRALLSEWQLVKSTNIPRELWVIRLVTAKGVEFLLSLPVLVLFFLFYWFRGQSAIDIDIVWFPVAILLQYLLSIGIGLVLAPITVIVNDVLPLVRIFLRVLFYMTPIIFNIQFLQRPGVPEFLTWIYKYHPMSGILELYRAGFFPNPVQWDSVAVAAVTTLVVLVLGSRVFTRMEKAVLKEI